MRVHVSNLDVGGSGAGDKSGEKDEVVVDDQFFIPQAQAVQDIEIRTIVVTG